MFAVGGPKDGGPDPPWKGAILGVPVH